MDLHQKFDLLAQAYLLRSEATELFIEIQRDSFLHRPCRNILR